MKQDETPACPFILLIWQRITLSSFSFPECTTCDFDFNAGHILTCGLSYSLEGDALCRRSTACKTGVHSLHSGTMIPFVTSQKQIVSSSCKSDHLHMSLTRHVQQTAAAAAAESASCGRNRFNDGFFSSSFFLKKWNKTEALQVTAVCTRVLSCPQNVLETSRWCRGVKSAVSDDASQLIGWWWG